MRIVSIPLVLLFGNAGIGLMIYAGLDHGVAGAARLEVFVGGLTGFLLSAIILAIWKGSQP